MTCVQADEGVEGDLSGSTIMSTRRASSLRSTDALVHHSPPSGLRGSGDLFPVLEASAAVIAPEFGAAR
jgi:hypothetical protein